MNPLTTSICALFVGTGLSVAFERLSDHERATLMMPCATRYIKVLRFACVVLVTGILFGCYHWASLDIRCLDIEEVQPGWSGRCWRLVYHLTLLGLLILATAIDFDCYMIPDAITLPGAIIGILGAAMIGEAQVCHLWVDWSIAVPQLRGPYMPPWYDAHRNLHGIAWSLAGLVTGASLTQLARVVSSCVIGKEAMGFGDVTLMGMIGSYLGWQGVTLVFLLAPVAGLTIGVLIRMVSGKTYLPYGPWLSIAAAAVLFNWSLLWRQTRLIFSDWLSVLVLGVVGSISFVLLLWLLQLYKSIPTRVRNTE